MELTNLYHQQWKYSHHRRCCRLVWKRQIWSMALSNWRQYPAQATQHEVRARCASRGKPWQSCVCLGRTSQISYMWAVLFWLVRVGIHSQHVTRAVRTFSSADAESKLHLRSRWAAVQDMWSFCWAIQPANGPLGNASLCSTGESSLVRAIPSNVDQNWNLRRKW